MAKLLTKYIKYLSEEKKLSKNTVDSYIRDINQLADYLGTVGINDLCDATNSVLITYVIHMKRANKAVSSITRGVVSMHSFYNFALISGYIENDPTIGLEVPENEEHTVSIMTQEEIKLLLDCPQTVDFKGYRDKAMFELLYATGIKVSELISLRFDEVDLKNEFIVCGKGSKRRAVPLGTMAVFAVSRYIENARNKQLVASQAPELFLNLNGQPLTRQGFWKILKTYKEKANIKSDITPHTVRHTFAVHMLENGTSIKDVQTMLGNNSQATSALYKKMLEMHINEVYKQAHPRAKIK